MKAVVGESSCYFENFSEFAFAGGGNEGVFILPINLTGINRGLS